MTLRQFIAACGTQELAARKLDVSFVTLNRWVNRHYSPGRKNKIKLAENGVKV